jgi:SAM-dependent methyltransferase
MGRRLRRARAMMRLLLKRGSGRRLLIRLTTRPSQRHGLVGPADLWAMKRRFQFRFLTAQGLRPEHRLLDIGCGTLRGGIPLIEYLQTGHYAGFEARAEVLQEGLEELAEAGLEHKRPRLIHASDPAEVQLEEPVDVAWAFSVLIHMPDEVVDACLALVARSLTEQGAFYANVNPGERRDRGWGEFPLVTRPLEFYERLAAAHGLVASEVGSLRDVGHRTGSAVQDGQVMLRFRRAGISGDGTAPGA